MGLGFEPQRNHSVLVFLEDSVKSHGCYEYSRRFNYLRLYFFYKQLSGTFTRTQRPKEKDVWCLKGYSVFSYSVFFAIVTHFVVINCK